MRLAIGKGIHDERFTALRDREMTSRYVHTQFLFTGILPLAVGPEWVGLQDMVKFQFFFIHCIDARIKSGHSSSDEAVKYFEDLRVTKKLEPAP